MRDDHLDALIDETARAMTGGLPPDALRTGVRQRIARRPWDTRRGWQAALATAVLVVSAAAAGRVLFLPDRVPPLDTQARPAVERMVAVPRLESPGGGATSAAPPPAPEPIRIEPLDVEPLARQVPLDLEPVEVPMPLRAERLEIEPLVFE